MGFVRTAYACLRPAVAMALTALSCSAFGATTYYVSASGSDSNSGTQAAPFRQIRAAIAVMQPGDTALVGDGSYLGFTMSGMNGTASAPITIKATGTGAQVTVTTDRTDNRDTILISLSSYIVIDGLTSFNANRAAVRIDQSPHVTAKNGKFGNNTTWGIFTDFSDYLDLENNECYGSVQQHGIYVSNTCTNPIVRGNRCHDNYGSGIHMNGDVSQGGAGIITGALVENNIIYNNGVGGGSGINMDGVQSSVIRNNLIYNNHASGISAYQIDAAQGPKNDEFYHNTVDMASDARWALHIEQTAGPMTVRNNILNNLNPNHGGIDFNTPNDIANTDSGYNIMDRVSPDDSSVVSLADWQSQGHEAGSFSATDSSLFAASGSGNYHLKAGSPAIDKGQTLSSVTVDMEGHSRPQGAASDIGCYEYPQATVNPHVLWNNSGKISLWTVTGPNQPNPTDYGPFPGWSAIGMASGSPDQYVRVLWRSDSGAISLWTVTAPGTFTYLDYGPYAGWTAAALAVGGDNQPRVLWVRTDGRISLWTVHADGTFATDDYGPFAGWQPATLAVGSDNHPRILWVYQPDQRISLWTITGPQTFSYDNYGPFPGWSPTMMAVGGDNLTRIGWVNGSQLSLWAITAPGTFTHDDYGPYPGWTAQLLAVGADNEPRVLWNNSGKISLWSITAPGQEQSQDYGPYAGWSPVALTP